MKMLVVNVLFAFASNFAVAQVGTACPEYHVCADHQATVEELFVCGTNSEKIPAVIVQAEVFQNSFVEGDKYFRPEIVVRSTEPSMQSAAKHWFFWDRTGSIVGNRTDSNVIEYTHVDMNQLGFRGTNGNEEAASIQRQGRGGRITLNGSTHRLVNCQNRQNKAS